MSGKPRAFAGMMAVSVIGVAWAASDKVEPDCSPAAAAPGLYDQCRAPLDAPEPDHVPEPELATRMPSVSGIAAAPTVSGVPTPTGWYSDWANPQFTRTKDYFPSLFSWSASPPLPLLYAASALTER
jgi:hypothetical protein